MSNFESIWKDLQTILKPGTVIRNWTAFHNYLGDSMTITKVSKTYVEFDAPKAKTIQHVMKEEFKKVWDVWEDYKNQKFRRSELREITHFSKYIISLLHWYEKEAKL